MTHPIHQVEQPPEVHNTLSNNSPKSSRTIPSNSHTSLVQAALLPFATILIWSFGLGSCLLGWLIAKRIPHPSGTSSHVFDGYLIVDEVNATNSEQTLNGQSIMKSNMRGVLIITAISNFSSIVTIPLMALGAFHVAAKWLDDQDQFNEGPTPLQFGLIMRMCSSGNWNSVFMTLRYLFRRWNADPPSARAKISPLVYRSLLITGLVVLLQYSRIVTDLLIKADLGSAYYSITTEVDIGSSLNASNLGTKYNPDNGYWEWLPKLLNQSQNFDPTTEWQILRWQGLETVIDRSDKNHIAMINTSNSSSIEDTSYMAVIVRPPSGLSSQ
ncbi:hypothetical protein FRC02_001602 [Tulasnella sp. 418]|nr:hypothetical protein FRC02_001602 [Tulasnella sp. 418]